MLALYPLSLSHSSLCVPIFLFKIFLGLNWILYPVLIDDRCLIIFFNLNFIYFFFPPSPSSSHPYRPFVSHLLIECVIKKKKKNASVCSLLENGSIALFGPLNGKLYRHVQSILDSLEIPHLECHWNTMRQSKNQLSVNIYPKHSIISRAFIDIVKAWNWKSFVIVYEVNEGKLINRDHRRIKLNWNFFLCESFWLIFIKFWYRVAQSIWFDR